MTRQVGADLAALTRSAMKAADVLQAPSQQSPPDLAAELRRHAATNAPVATQRLIGTACEAAATLDRHASYAERATMGRRLANAAHLALIYGRRPPADAP